MTIYTAEPNSPTAHALALLASWATTQDLRLPAPPDTDPLGPRPVSPVGRRPRTT
jgi:hypothetical protein